MVSQSGSPPIPMPVQVPPGHVMQQIVDESGALRHVILSTAQHQGGVQHHIHGHYVSLLFFSLIYKLRIIKFKPSQFENIKNLNTGWTGLCDFQLTLDISYFFKLIFSSFEFYLK